MKISAKSKSEISSSLLMYAPILVLAVLFYGSIIGVALIYINNKYLLLPIGQLHIFCFSWGLSFLMMTYYSYFVIKMLSKSYIDISSNKLAVCASHGFTSSPIEFNLSEINEVAFGQPLNWAEDVLLMAKSYGVPGLKNMALVKDVKEGKLYVTVDKKTTTFNLIHKAFNEEDLQKIMLELAKNNIPIKIA